LHHCLGGRRVEVKLRGYVNAFREGLTEDPGILFGLDGWEAPNIEVYVFRVASLSNTFVFVFEIDCDDDLSVFFLRNLVSKCSCGRK